MIDSIDEYVGKRLRIARRASKLSQEDLGNVVGVSYQQIQKLETGQNRVSAGRLYQFSQTLNKPLNWFFEGFGDRSSVMNHDLTHLERFLHAWASIDNEKSRKLLLGIIKVFVEQEKQQTSNF